MIFSSSSAYGGLSLVSKNDESVECKISSSVMVSKKHWASRIPGLLGSCITLESARTDFGRIKKGTLIYINGSNIDNFSHYTLTTPGGEPEFAGLLELKGSEIYNKVYNDTYIAFKSGEIITLNIKNQ